MPAWKTSKARSEQDVTNEARANNRKVHSATLMDFCCLEYAVAEHMQHAEADNLVDARLSMERLLALTLWDLMIDVLELLAS